MSCKYCKPKDKLTVPMFCIDIGNNGESEELSGFPYMYDENDNLTSFEGEWKVYKESVGLLPKLKEEPYFRKCHSNLYVFDGEIDFGLAYGEFAESICTDIGIKINYCPFCGRKFNV